MGIKKGTKLTDHPKNQILRIRMDEDTANKLKAVCEKKQKSMSDVVRDGIEQQYDRLKK